jgi:hypothetical protein
VVATGEASLGYDPGPPHVIAHGQGGKIWNLHMEPTGLRSMGLRKDGIISPTELRHRSSPTTGTRSR